MARIIPRARVSTKPRPRTKSSADRAPRRFKASQFVAGVVQAIFVGAILYSSCIPDCSSADAPGSHPAFREALVLFLVRVALCWAALCLLPFATVKGGYRYEPLRGELRLKDVARKGGRVWYFMYYDAAVFGACVVMGYLVFLEGQNGRPATRPRGRSFFFLAPPRVGGGCVAAPPRAPRG